MKLIEFKFKGARNYVQAGDFFNEISLALAPTGAGYLGKLVFKSFARNHCYLYDHKPEEEQRSVGSCAWVRSDGETATYWIVESDRPVTDSYVFQEELIVDRATVRGEEIFGDGSNPYSTIENIIALNKKLCYALSPAVDGRWVFGQINLTKPLPEKFRAMLLRRTHALADKFSRSSIEIDGDTFGEVRFIVGKP